MLHQALFDQRRVQHLNAVGPELRAEVADLRACFQIEGLADRVARRVRRLSAADLFRSHVA